MELSFTNKVNISPPLQGSKLNAVSRAHEAYSPCLDTCASIIELLKQLDVMPSHSTDVIYRCQMDPFASNFISVDEHSGFSQKGIRSPSSHGSDKARVNQNPQTHGFEALEAQKELEHPTTEVQDEFWALTDKPYFHCVLAKSQVKNCSNMGLPSKISQLLPEKEIPVVITCRNKKWRMKYYGDRTFKRFDPGWKKFANDNNLNVGDGCVFELTECSKECIKFRVQILDGNIPSEFLDRVDGETLNHPIMIE
ncbi:B3 DNA binding domain [Macleaya cordata]|uniref:B3 DNA binding domain n=1 Tax=Macleaya cordata TaxID=56857 RepID=A0A200PXB5_MACCD|nr:B3 DNA binding domain [Macleaya cordata]